MQKNDRKQSKTATPAKLRGPGTLIIIGGGEDKKGERTILKEVAAHVGGGTLVVATVASDEAAAVWETYNEVFHALGIKRVKHLDVERRDDATDDRHLKTLDDASTVFFTGGDQLKIAARL